MSTHKGKMISNRLAYCINHPLGGQPFRSDHRERGNHIDRYISPEKCNWRSQIVNPGSIALAE